MGEAITCWKNRDEAHVPVTLHLATGWFLLGVGGLVEEHLTSLPIWICLYFKAVKSSGRVLGLVCSQGTSKGQITYFLARFLSDKLCLLTNLQVCSGLWLLAQTHHTTDLSQDPSFTCRCAEFQQLKGDALTVLDSLHCTNMKDESIGNLIWAACSSSCNISSQKNGELHYFFWVSWPLGALSCLCSLRLLCSWVAFQPPQQGSAS